MKTFTVYFELFGKKMKHTLLAQSKEDAKYQVQKKIIFHKVIEEKSVFDNIMDILGRK